MQLQQTSTTSQTDYLGPDIDEIAQQRRGSGIDPLDSTAGASTSSLSRAVGRRLLPSALAVPPILWGLISIGQLLGWYDVEVCFVLLVFSVAAVFGLIVCMSLKRLSALDAEREQAREQLKRAKEAAETANRFKSAFFASISHEIRTPLTAINGFAELLVNPARGDDERLNDARIIRRNGEHLLTLINDILDLSKIESGKMSVERILCRPAAVVNEVCSMLRHRAEEKNLTLSVQYKGTIPGRIKTDPTRLRQILINLVTNAVKFTKQGGVNVAVSMKTPAGSLRPVIQIEVADSGIGIPPEQLPMLFQPFVQGDASIARQYGGTGLGLAISRHFSRALGGDITVTSEPNRGSQFTVFVETDSLEGVEADPHPEQAAHEPETVAAQNVRINGRVLVAEDGIDNQALIATRLRQTGLTVEIAPNGQIAVEKALAAQNTRAPFDLVLMDVQMPVMDGFNATLNLRNNGFRAPIIALTANAMQRDRKKCMDAGCNDFVTKPIQMEALFKAMGRYLRIEAATARENSLIADSSASDGLSAGVNESRGIDFHERLAEMLADIDEAIEREQATRVGELVQLILGQAAAAGAKHIAVESARLLQTIQSESRWSVLREHFALFTREIQPKPQLQAA